ncbi:hypothetical protein JZ751_002090 [Albula glossodonta]|uniref:Uncharacterized protein n=1 Tax=Albula glossodonta TaxID=121402 RepID=A0A8T2P717_9TELE|nr:hypothetical protein JZ751_002090 [Albula glossodonta]
MATPEPLIEDDGLSSLEIILFSIIIVTLIYWIMFRERKKEEIPEFKKLTTLDIFNGPSQHHST